MMISHEDGMFFYLVLTVGICETEKQLDVLSKSVKDFCGRDQAELSCINDKELRRPVRCSPMQRYIDDAATSTGLSTSEQRIIDFMSIDIEEFFMSALRSINIASTFVRVMVIECSTNDCYEWLDKHGYLYIKAGTIAKIPVDTIAWRNGS